MIVHTQRWVMAAGLLLLVACGAGETDHNKTNKVIYVSVPPHAYLARAIAAPQFEVRSLIQAGQDPHHWQPTPKQMLALGNAAAWLPANLPFEQRLLSKIQGKQATEQEHGHQHHDHAGETHTWLSPPAMIEKSQQMVQILSELDPEHAKLFEQRAAKLEEKIEQVHHQLQKQLAPYKGRSFLVFHNALQPFANTYGLKQCVIQSGDASPDPKRLRDRIQLARTEQLTTIFVQPQFDSQSAKIVAQAIGGKMISIDPLAEDVLANVKKIADALELSFVRD
ncbi:MAG: zinc ABC transporter substrate-binding protein [Verrucomicrobiales bacterium]|nr:zinc ABC transporter substrate-binding protein [Verrucomicrobiales bacterium]